MLNFKFFIFMTLLVLSMCALADPSAQQRAMPALEASPAMAHDHPTGIQLPLADVSTISAIMDDQEEVAVEEINTDGLTARQ